MKISLISAVASNGVIGRNNGLPWHLPDDFAFFKRKTSHHPIIMGRRSLDALGKPLPNRTNIVVTRNPAIRVAGVLVTQTIDQAIDQARRVNQEEIFVIGGAEIYALALPLATTLYLTEIDKAYAGDTYFPPFDRSKWQEVDRQFHPADDRHEASFNFVEYQRKSDR